MSHFYGRIFVMNLPIGTGVAIDRHPRTYGYRTKTFAAEPNKPFYLFS